MCHQPPLVPPGSNDGLRMASYLSFYPHRGFPQARWLIQAGGDPTKQEAGVCSEKCARPWPGTEPSTRQCCCAGKRGTNSSKRFRPAIRRCFFTMRSVEQQSGAVPILGGFLRSARINPGAAWACLGAGTCSCPFPPASPYNSHKIRALPFLIKSKRGIYP